jgi:DNA-binding NtrC family response regulator
MTETTAARILIIEDDRALSEVLCDELRARGHMVAAAENVAEGGERLKESDFDVALVDLVLPDGGGLDVLRQVHDHQLPMECIVLAGHAAVSAGVEAMKLGAYDYVTKPARMEELEMLVQKAADKARLRRENESLRVRLARHEDGHGLVTEDPAMAEVLATLERVAASELPVLIQGESGTGKELLARAVHQRSHRAGGPFVAVNCAAFSESILESELFGHEKGAFTGAVGRKPGLFEVADRGVLFLDEIGGVSPMIQAKLLRALETKEFFRVGATRVARTDVRIVSATHRNLKAEMQAGGFREDLYYRLNGITLRLPPLRERKQDVLLLATHFLRSFAPNRRLSPRALETLKSYAWPGNVRELQMVIHRAAILSAQDPIDVEDLPIDIRDLRGRTLPLPTTGMTLEELEREYIQTVLRENDGHRGKTARALGIDPKTLYNKLGPERPRAKK